MRLVVGTRKRPGPADDRRVRVDQYADCPLSDASDRGGLAVDEGQGQVDLLDDTRSNV